MQTHARSSYAQAHRHRPGKRQRRDKERRMRRKDGRGRRREEEDHLVTSCARLCTPTFQFIGWPLMGRNRRMALKVLECMFTYNSSKLFWKSDSIFSIALATALAVAAGSWKGDEHTHD